MTRVKTRGERRSGGEGGWARRKERRRTRSESGDAPGKLVMPALSASRTRALLRAGRKKARVNSARGGGGGARGREERRTKPRRCCASTRSAPRRAASLPHGCHLQVHEFSISTRACEGEADERERRTDLLVRSSLQLLDVGRVGARVGGGAQAGDARLPGFSESLRAQEEDGGCQGGERRAQRDESDGEQGEDERRACEGRRGVSDEIGKQIKGRGRGSAGSRPPQTVQRAKSLTSRGAASTRSRPRP